MNNCFILLAAGQSKRFKSIKFKQYAIYKNKPIFEHSLDKIIQSKLFKHLILVTNKKIPIKKIPIKDENIIPKLKIFIELSLYNVSNKKI